MTSGFSTPFRHYLPNDENALRLAMTTGMVVLDTNVLLSAYRFAPAAREELMSVVERVADRIWIPHRVAEEFHRNRLEVIADYDTAYLPVIEALSTAQDALDDELGPKIGQLANRAALSDAQRENLLDLVAKSTAAATFAVSELRKDHGLADLRGSDAVLTKFQKLLDGKTGAPLNDQDMADAISEAKHRIDQRIPPGYRDVKKPEPYGDFVIWKQTLLESTSRQASHVVFVTSDTKEDWYQIVKGKTIGGRPELAKELMDATGAELVVMTATSFLFHANNYLNAKVSQETIRQSETLPKPESRTEKASRRNELRAKRINDIDRLVERIRSRRALIVALQEALEARLEDDPDCELPETVALQRHLEESKNSERILRRRYEQAMANFEIQMAENLTESSTTSGSEDDESDFSERGTSTAVVDQPSTRHDLTGQSSTL